MQHIVLAVSRNGEHLCFILCRFKFPQILTLLNTCMITSVCKLTTNWLFTHVLLNLLVFYTYSIFHYAIKHFTGIMESNMLSEISDRTLEHYWRFV